MIVPDLRFVQIAAARWAGVTLFALDDTGRVWVREINHESIEAGRLSEPWAPITRRGEGDLTEPEGS